MTRKEFFAAIGGAFAAAVAAVKLDAKPTALSLFNVPDADGVVWLPEGHPVRGRYLNSVCIYRGYAIGWTGWKESQSNLNLAGQWVGSHMAMIDRKDYRKGSMVYASCPGCAMFYMPGDQANLAAENEWMLKATMFNSPPEMKEEAKRRTLVALTRFIDKECQFVK